MDDEKKITEKIFEQIENQTEFEKVCASFTWLFNHGFLAADSHLYNCAMKTFRRINQLQ